MKAWDASVLMGERRGGRLARAAAILLLAGILLWALRSADQGRGPHAVPAGDPFERAGVVELKEGQRSPGLRLASLDGSSVALEDFAGKLLVLNFWATWCTPCEVEMPTLESLWQKLRARGLVVLAVSVDRGAPRSLLDPYVKGKGLTFPVLLDPDMATARAWRVTSLPASFLVKPNGEVAGMVHGLREWDSGEMLALLESLLPAHPARPAS